MPIPAVVTAMLANPKFWLLVNLLANKAIRSIFVKVASMTDEEIEEQIKIEEARKDELMDILDSH